MARPFYIVDVFAQSRYAGNPLAVIRHAADLSAAQMLAITREMNYSESTFILSDEAGKDGYRVRIFTPGGELPFAGHPTLGTAYIIQREILQQPVAALKLHLAVGTIPVTFEVTETAAPQLWMRQMPPHFGQTLKVEPLAAALRLSPADFDERFAAQEISTGVSAVIVPLKNRAALERAQVQVEAYYAALESCNNPTVLLFCAEPLHPENHLHARVFAHHHGIPEDPATGSANGCLAAYLAQHQYFGAAHPPIVRVEQGYQLQRPSLLHLRVQPGPDGFQIEVGGTVFSVARGTLD